MKEILHVAHKSCDMLGIVWERSNQTSLHHIGLLFLLFLFYSTTNAGRTQRHYGQVVVAVSPQIPLPDSKGLIDILKDLFTRASKRLYQATRNGTSFETITILVPPNAGFYSESANANHIWSNFSSSAATAPVSYQTADVRVDVASPPHGDKPYTEQPRGCGQPGDFVHITSNFLLEWNQTKDEQGVSLLVKQWARYRYGIFDERGWKNSTRFPSQYLSQNGEPMVTGCSNPYKWTLRPNTTCTPTELYNQACQFQMKDNLTLASSLMDDELAETFCDDSAERQHDSHAPTRQNAICQERSTWSVIETHPDFHISSSHQKPFVEPPPPVFHMLEAPQFTAILVIDPHLCWISTEFQKISWTFQIAVRKLLRELPAGSRLGMMLADNGTDSEFTGLISDATQILTAFNGLCLTISVDARELSKGIHDGYEIIKSEVAKTLIFLYDGRNVSEEVFSDIQMLLEQDKALNFFILTYPASLLTLQEPIVKHLLSKKNLQWYNIRQTENTTDECDLQSVIALDEALTNIISQQYLGFSLAKTSLHYQYHNSSSNPAEGTFAIGSHGLITIACYLCSASNNPNKVYLWINGKKKPMNAVSYDLWTTSSNETASALTYSASVARPAPLAVAISMQHNQWHPDEFFTVQGQVEDVVYAYSRTTNFKVTVIRAILRKGISPVLSAQVEALVLLPGLDEQVTIQLLDNGGGDPDIVANDGIYSRYFTQFTNKSGLYDVRIRVNNKSRSRKGSPSNEINEEHLLSSFTATSYIGSFYTDGKDDSKDIYPPNRITDLQVEFLNGETNTVTFKWTAPGEDLDYGRASSLELKISKTKSKMAYNNLSVQTISWIPTQDAGLLETHEVSLPECGVVLYFTMTARDAAGQNSLPSNVVSLYSSCTPTTTVATLPASTDLPSTSIVHSTTLTIENNATTVQASSVYTGDSTTRKNNGVAITTAPSLTTNGSTEEHGLRLSKMDIYIISGVAAGAVLLILLIILCYCCCTKRRRKSKSDPVGARPRRLNRDSSYHVDIVRRWSSDIADDDYNYSHVSLQGGIAAENAPPSEGVTPPSPTSSSGPERRNQQRSLVPRNIPAVTPPSGEEYESDGERNRYSTLSTLEFAPLPVLHYFPSAITPTTPPQSTFRKGPARTLHDYQLPRAEVTLNPNSEYQSVIGPPSSSEKLLPPDIPIPNIDRGTTRDVLPRRPAPPAYETLYPNRTDSPPSMTIATESSHGCYNDSFNSNGDPGLESAV